MWFASDNAGPAHPAVLDALARANAGYAASYGADALMATVRDRIRALFEAPEAAVYLVATGTAANALALATLAPPWSAIFCHRAAHVEMDECGAVEFYTGGAKLALIEGAHGRMDPDAFGRAVTRTGAMGVHGVQPGALSLTSVTEAGTVYTLEQIRALTAIARAHGMPVHLDGARFANALVALDCSPAEMTWKAGVDAVSFGGTKNGLMGVEAVILFDPARAWEFELRRKRGGHLFSKHRYLSAQMLAYLDNDLWLDLARAANAAGQRLAAGLKALPRVSFQHPPEANMIFATWPRADHRRLRAAGAQYYLWDADSGLDGPGDAPLTARLVCNWSTETAAIDRFLAVLGAEEVADQPG